MAISCALQVCLRHSPQYRFALRQTQAGAKQQLMKLVADLFGSLCGFLRSAIQIRSLLCPCLCPLPHSVTGRSEQTKPLTIQRGKAVCYCKQINGAGAFLPTACPRGTEIK